MLEDYEDRCKRWNPSHVIISTLPEAVMVDPEAVALKLTVGYSLHLIACRNLARRALQKCCKMHT